MRKHVYHICYLREAPKNKKKLAEFHEAIVAESWQDALHYWRTEFADEGVEIQWLKRGEPVVSICPKEDRP